MDKQRLGHKNRMLGVIADHPAAQEQPMPPGSGEKFSRAATRQPFDRQTERIPDSRS
jgi:hypothetical protein